MSEESIVFVTYNGNTHQFFIDDIEPEFLQATFELLEAPTTLFSVASNLAIPIAKKRERLKSGDSYYIKFKKKQVNVRLDEFDSYTKYTNRIKYPENETDIILNSLVASTAVYYNIDESEVQDGGECGKYLQEQLNNHNFEYIVRNKYGSNNFLIAKVCNNLGVKTIMYSISRTIFRKSTCIIMFFAYTTGVKQQSNLYCFSRDQRS